MKYNLTKKILTCVAGSYILSGISNAATLNFSEDLTSTIDGVVIVDASTDSVSPGFFIPAGDQILNVSVEANISSSSGSINPDGTVVSNGGSSFLNELSLTLTSAEGTTVELISANTYTSGPNSQEFIDFTFSDTGTAQSDATLGSGTFAPTLGSLSDFNGETASGLWTLTIGDSVNADPKSLNSYSITIETGAIPEPSSTLLLGLGGLALVARRKR